MSAAMIAARSACAMPADVADTSEPRDDELLLAADVIASSSRLAADTLAYASALSAASRPSAEQIVTAYWQAAEDELAATSDTDAFRLYLRDVARLGPPMTRDIALAAARRGDVDALVNGNLLLVVSVAKRWWSFRWRSLLDMIQEGNLGLIRAATKFDPQRATTCSFGHYAYFWIERYVRNEAYKQDVPSGILSYTAHISLVALRTARTRLQRELNCALTLTETIGLLERRRIPAPRSLKHGWPSARDAEEWLSVIHPVYLSELVYESNPGDSDGRWSYADVIEGGTPAELLLDEADNAECEPEPAAPLRSGIELTAALRVLVEQDALDEQSAELLVLRYGIAHPSGASWHAPLGWRLGGTQAFRLVATQMRVPRTTLQRWHNDLLAQLAALHASPLARRFAQSLAITHSTHGGAKRRSLTR